MAMGEAAGVAAALAVQRGTLPVELEGASVRDALAVRGAGPFTDHFPGPEKRHVQIPRHRNPALLN